MAQSPELAAGSGFTFEDQVAARYLAALLCESSAPATGGALVRRVALQQRDLGEPLDDVIVDFERLDEKPGRVSLQAKRSLTVSAAKTNTDFREVVRDSLRTLQKADFRQNIDLYGAASESVAQGSFDTLNSLCELARASVSTSSFEARFDAAGNANQAQREMRDDIRTILSDEISGPCPGELLHRFLRHFVLIRFDFRHEGGISTAEAIDFVRPALRDDDANQAQTLWALLCQAVRNGAGRSREYTRAALVNLVARQIPLRAAPSFRSDLSKLRSLAKLWVDDIRDDVGGVRLVRDSLQSTLEKLLSGHRFVQIRGLPGSGKSVLMRRRIESELTAGPVLFLKSDRLEGKSWHSFASAFGLKSADLLSLLVEIGATGSCTLYIDGIDRVEKQHQGVIVDLVRLIIKDPLLSSWRIVVSLRDTGLEPVRTWLPDLFESGHLGTLEATQLNDREARLLAEKQPKLAPLLFGNAAVREIVRRPFFAKILSQGFVTHGIGDDFAPRSEVDLLAAWWSRGGFNAVGPSTLPRQRALVELGATRARSLTSPIQLSALSQPTINEIHGLVEDGILQSVTLGHAVQFTHDIFFEWSFFHRLLDCGERWLSEIGDIGEPPVIGRIVELLSISEFRPAGKWSSQLDSIQMSNMRSQWARAWLLGPLSTPRFDDDHAIYWAKCSQDNFRLLRKALVWFQAEKTVPNARILEGGYGDQSLKRDEVIRIADLLGWPSDFEAWKRVLTFLLDHLSDLPRSLIPDVVVLFEVWQNVFSGFRNSTSDRLLEQSAAWLNEIERLRHSRSLQPTSSPWSEIDSALSGFEGSLRTLILRASETRPDLVSDYLNELKSDEHRLEEVFEELIAFSPFLSQSHPALLVDITLLNLKERLPKARIEEEKRRRRAEIARREQIRKKLSSERTPKEELVLGGPRTLIGSPISHFDWEELALNKELSFYFPPSPLREPFFSLFRESPDEALRLTRELTNHAVAAWRELHEIDAANKATPIPLVLEFPWGTQEFWGTRREYLWYRSIWAPKPLACAYLALEDWAFKQLSDGRPADEVLQQILNGNQCIAVLGTAVSVLLQSHAVTQATLPLITAQKLWKADLERVAGESTNSSAMLIGFTGPPGLRHAQAVDKLNKLKVRRLWLRDIVPAFVLASDKNIADCAREKIANFETELPYDYQEQRGEKQLEEALLQDARFNAEFAKLENYSASPDPQDSSRAVVVMENPEANRPAVKQRLEEIASQQRESLLWIWANKSLAASDPSSEFELMDAISFAKGVSKDLFQESVNVDDPHVSIRRGAVAGVAAVALTYRDKVNMNDHEWARATLSEASAFREQRGELWSASAIIPWHHGIFAAKGLAADIRLDENCVEARRNLLRLISHPLEAVSLAALQQAASLWDVEPRFSWCAIWQALALCQMSRTNFGEQLHYSPEYRHVRQAIRAEEAIRHYERADFWPQLLPMPEAWVRISARHSGSGDDEASSVSEDAWGEPDLQWDWSFSPKILQRVPILALYRCAQTRAQLLTFVRQLVSWVIARIDPPWRDDGRRDRPDRFYELDRQLGDLIAILAGELDTARLRELYLDPVSSLEDELCFDLLEPFLDSYVCRYIFDSPSVPANAIEVLLICLERVLKDRTFKPNAYRAGELHGWKLPKIVLSLLFVSVEKADLASRFVNGNWQDIQLIIPVVDRFVRAAGWSASVMNSYLLLCERARETYPAESFADQVLSILTLGRERLIGWHGTLLPARIAGLVQYFSSREAPLSLKVGQKFLRILDELIDMGDRRSAALQIGDSFRSMKAA